MNKDIFQARLRRLRKKLGSPAPDTLWITRPENRRYLSGFKAGDFDLTESSGSLLINAGHAYLLTDSRYALEAQKEARNFKVLTFKKSLFDHFPDLLAGLGTKNLGIEEEFVTLAHYRKLQRKLRKSSGPVRLTPLKDLLDQMRAVKDPVEIKQIAKASEVMSQVLARVIKKLKPGCTEKEIAWLIQELSQKAGADGLAFPPIVASGPHSALPHAAPSNRKIRAREPIVLDAGLRWNGYCCDMTRTIFIGEPRPKFKKIYTIVRQAQLAGLAGLRAGIKSSLPDHKARQIIADAGFGKYLGHALGHGVGLATHETPGLSSYAKPVILKKSMIVTVEPGIYIPHQGGVRLEDTVLITTNGYKMLTKNPYYNFT